MDLDAMKYAEKWRRLHIISLQNIGAFYTETDW